MIVRIVVHHVAYELFRNEYVFIHLTIHMTDRYENQTITENGIVMTCPHARNERMGYDDGDPF
jgi:hypothetical protein